MATYSGLAFGKVSSAFGLMINSQLTYMIIICIALGNSKGKRSLDGG
jgi:hypothetical protein